MHIILETVRFVKHEFSLICEIFNKTDTTLLRFVNTLSKHSIETKENPPQKQINRIEITYQIEYTLLTDFIEPEDKPWKKKDAQNECRSN